MSFLFAAALAIGLLVAAPLLAHKLRRGRAQPQNFPCSHLVPSAVPAGRRIGKYEDRWLFT